jgi:6,7-dimethyl-8-ribityllumazine synthase
MPPKTIEGKTQGQGRRVAIVASRFNDLIGRRLVAGAVETLTFHGTLEKDIEIVWVPGAWELPVAAAKLLKTGRFDAAIALGTVIQGETTHHEYIAREVSASLTRLTEATGLPVSFGVLTTENLDQALARAGESTNNKGAEAALHLLETLSALEQIK